jgi:GH15 family glucan-1,4-alpha-glucosidase
MRTVSHFTLAEGEAVPFVLSYGPSHLPPPGPVNPRAALAATQEWWKTWASQSRVFGEMTEPVTRSLITLKALTYAPTGGIVAAVTTSLPEQLGGVRNWDYRFCWVRDATLTLQSLLHAGYTDEARAWRDWLLRAVAGSPAEMQIMYGPAG